MHVPTNQDIIYGGKGGISKIHNHKQLRTSTANLSMFKADRTLDLGLFV